MVKIPNIRLPIPKKPIIKGIPNNYLLGGLAIGGIVTYYYLTSKGLIQGITIPGLGEGGEGTGNKINFTITPQTVQPNSTIQIQGQVLGTDGQPFTASKIYYYIYREQADGTTLFYTAGTAGESTSSFTKVIATTNYPAGSYIIAVSDIALTAPPQILPGQTPVGGQNPPVPEQNTLPYEDNTGGLVSLN